MTPAILAPALVLVLASSGCVRLTSGAAETFASERACPESRVTAIERGDLAASTFIQPEGPPPPDIAGDTARVRAWEQHEAEVRAFLDDAWTIVEVRGCDADVLYRCAHPFHGRRGVDFGSVSCAAVKGITKR